MSDGTTRSVRPIFKWMHTERGQSSDVCRQKSRDGGFGEVSAPRRLGGNARHRPARADPTPVSAGLAGRYYSAGADAVPAAGPVALATAAGGGLGVGFAGFAGG